MLASLTEIMPSPYLWSGIPAAMYYAYYYKTYCGQVPEIYGADGAFLRLMKEKCPALHEEYRPPPLVHESRLMTIFASIGRHRGLNFPYMRELFITSDGGEIALDWWDARLKPKSPSEVPVVSSTSLVDSLSYYFRFPSLQIPYFGSAASTSAPDTSGDISDASIPTGSTEARKLSVGDAPSSVPELDDLVPTHVHLPKSVSNITADPADVDVSVAVEHPEKLVPIAEKNADGADQSAVGRSDVYVPEPTGLVLILPGLTGNSGQNYVRGLVQVVEELGFTAIVMNYRGMAGDLKTPKSYCAVDTTDIAEVIQLLKRRYPTVPVMAVGISLGGILLCQYLAYCGKNNIDSLLVGVMAVSVGWNIFESCKTLEQPLNWLLFNRMLTRSLCAAVHRHSNMLKNNYDLEGLKNVRTIREFDSHITSKMFGFSDVDEYYKNASLYDKIQFIKTPLLALNAADDVFSPNDAIPREEAKKNPNMCLVVTSHGGHIGFLEQRNPFGRNYVERLFEQFARAVFENRDILPVPVRIITPHEEVPVNTAEIPLVPDVDTQTAPSLD
ncbi:protein ABHD1-like [Paramacrobiotus metropolitanus]|uniref:protein ABHD1-like n=1 Tax=Paramacrobiotus metropolitanus TaxID=2943436 RepID=UPI0024459908|nr:protein ABHD1-like [Paramacrobiotus metropolitanus]